MSLRKKLKRWNPFRVRTAAELAIVDLEEAERDLLAAEATFDYVSAQVDMYQTRVERLRNTINNNASRAADAPHQKEQGIQ